MYTHIILINTQRQTLVVIICCILYVLQIYVIYGNQLVLYRSFITNHAINVLVPDELLQLGSSTQSHTRQHNAYYNSTRFYQAEP